MPRTGALAPLALLDPARRDGAGAAFVIALALGLIATGVGPAFAAWVASAIGAAAMTLLPAGGQTGDVAGAAQQWAEIAAWCSLLMGVPVP